MVKKIGFLFIFILFVSSALGGIRGPGKYAGVVIFYRWDTCYLDSGTYLMYITERKKELLRKYKGQSVLIDAKEVSQPMNPGDGLITEFEFLGKAEAKENLPQVDGLKLTVVPKFQTTSRAEFELAVENQSDKTISVITREIAPTVFGEKSESDYFSPSDGKSTAKITRFNLESAKTWKREATYSKKNAEGKEIRETESYSVEVKDIDSLPKSFQLRAEEKRQFIIALNLPAGDYDFLFGYGGGVHEGKSLASNIISFSVDKTGKAILIASKTKETKVAETFDSNMTKLSFGNFSVDTIFSKFQIL